MEIVEKVGTPEDPEKFHTLRRVSLLLGRLLGIYPDKKLFRSGSRRVGVLLS